jgi:DNA-binding PadR family transcriptional regulator
MRNRDFNQSPNGRSRFTETGEGDQFEGRSGRRGGRSGRHGVGHSHGHEHGDGETSMRGGRGRRGDVRLAVLALLNERPMHGYEMMQELADRTQGLWRPSPGSLYPALQLLEDQGLVRSETGEGRRQFTLTDEGRAELAKNPRASAPWEAMVRGADQGDVALRVAMRHVMIAVRQVAEAGTADQKARAERLIVELRRQMYLLLAEATEPPVAQ